MENNSNKKKLKRNTAAVFLLIFLFLILTTGPNYLNFLGFQTNPTPLQKFETIEMQSHAAIEGTITVEPFDDKTKSTDTAIPIFDQLLVTPGSTIMVISTPTAASPTPEPERLNISTEWNQDAANAQRTGFISEEPELPWELLWTWNGPDQRGGTEDHFYNAPPEARTITGGDYLFAPAGVHGLYSLLKIDGSIAWNFRGASVTASPAYDPLSNMIFIGGEDGILYKINVLTGEVVGKYQANSSIIKSILLSEGYVYSVTESGLLHKVNKIDMSPAWIYDAGSRISTPPAYSALSKVIIFATEDLHLHGVNENDGTARWRVNPTPNPARFPFTFDGYWPVISEQHGIAFFRLNLGMDGLWSGPMEGQKYPQTNQEVRIYLKDNPHLKNLFALDLETGKEKFIPAVGYGGVEMLDNDDRPELITGPVPVIKTQPDGSEVAYIFFRNGQSPHPDGRWDSHIGEMVLDDHTIPGLEAGDLRFVQFNNSFIHITDEQCPLTMAGSTLFHAHWGASESTRITDRSPELGFSYDNPIRSEPNPVIIRRMQSCPDFNPQTHWTTCGLTLYDDGRFWNGPGWWVYWDTLDPPTPSRRAYSEGILPRYTYVSDGLVIVQGNGGELAVFKHSGR
jgi:outer membrane protein assembly factor BamB